MSRGNDANSDNAGECRPNIIRLPYLLHKAWQSHMANICSRLYLAPVQLVALAIAQIHRLIAEMPKCPELNSGSNSAYNESRNL